MRSRLTAPTANPITALPRLGEPPPRRVDPRPPASIELGLGLKTKSVLQPVQSPGDRFHRLYPDLGETEEDTTEL